MTSVLHWLLRRHVDAGDFAADVADGGGLILVIDHPSLAGEAGPVTVGDRPVRVVRGGELVIRAALLDGPPLVAIVPPERPLQRDLTERAWLRQRLQVNLRDRVAAAAGRHCAALTDDALNTAIEAEWETVAARLPEWRLQAGRPVTSADLRAVLDARTEKRPETSAPPTVPPEDLLARWLIDGPPVDRALARRLLDWSNTADDMAWRWLARVADPRGRCHEEAPDPTEVGEALSTLITDGAAGGLASLRGALGPRTGTESLGRLRDLVESAVRAVYPAHPEKVREHLAEAETLAARARLSVEEAARAPLLSAAFEALACGLMARAASRSGPRPDVAEIRALRRCLQRDDAVIESVVAASRLAAFADDAEEYAPIPRITDPEAEAAAWARFARRHTAPADRLIRTLHRERNVLARDLAEAATAVYARAQTVRDRLNRRFAEALARREVPIYAGRHVGDGMPLHRVTSRLVGPMLEDGRSVLLVVLDGCDGGSMFDVLAGLPEQVGLRRPRLSEKTKPYVRDAIDAALPDGLCAALSPLPTLTAVGRRALFAGQIPANAALSEREAEAADASGDRKAWTSNPAVESFEPTLLLKGDLDADLSALHALLESERDQAPRAVAVVFNEIDDALSSKQTGLPDRWTPAKVHPALPRLLVKAVNAEWHVLVTADHGHTTFVRGRKVAGKRRGQRIAAEAVQGSVRFAATAWRPEPVHLLVDSGAWLGTQRIGFHGGASIEEVVVPIMHLGRVDAESGPGRLPEPEAGWLWGEPAVVEAEEAVDGAAPTEAPPTSTGVPTTASVDTPAARVDPPAVVEAPMPPALDEPAPAQPPPTAEPPTDGSRDDGASEWLSAISDESTRAALLHLEKHGTLTEPQLARMLGSARKARRFARRFDGYREAVPFRVEIQVVAGVKRYEKVKG